MKQQIQDIAERIFPKLVEIRRHIHSNPELSFKEYETCSYVFEKLGKMGLEPQKLSDTGVVCMIKGSGSKVIALRADMDALPIFETNDVEYKSKNEGVMHACGHDVHTTSLLGAAMILNELKSELKGSIKLIFQPGEEKLPGGASIMIKDGVLENPKPEAILGQHVYPELEAGKIGLKSGQYMASADEVYLTIKGRGGHAALPHRNIDPIVIASHVILGLQQVVSRRAKPDTPTVLSFGKIEGKGATNIIPDEVKIEGTFRTFDEGWRKEAHTLIEEMARSIAESMGATCDAEVRRGYPFVNNDEALIYDVRSNAIEFLGAENVVDLELRMTGEDFSFYSQEMPGCFYRLGTGNEARGIKSPVHTSTFDVDEESLKIGASLMAWLTIKELEK